MSISVLEFEANNIHVRQLQAAAAITFRPWLKAHTVTVNRVLEWLGVTEREDRAELTQEVFFAAYRALVQGEQIKSPRAWLVECARKYASNYRRKVQRRSAHAGGGFLVYGKDPEQITSDRERLNIALATLTEAAKVIVFDIRIEGVSWGEAAQERGITIDQARYLYGCAISQMEKVLCGLEKKVFRATMQRISQNKERGVR